MSEHEKDGEREKQSPTHRVSFARINGQDRQGRDLLGPAREIGSIWERKGKEGEGILRFDHIPEEMRSQGGGVLFVSAARERENGGAKAGTRESAKPRDRDDGRDDR